MNPTASTTESRPNRSHAFPPPREVRFSDIEDAARRVRGTIVESPCTPLASLGTRAGVTLHVKRDYLQATCSFKERGAANVLGCLSPVDRRRGVVAASAGNHALGLALHGARLSVPVTLVMPVNAARVKVDRCKSLGAKVVLFGESFDQADGEARLYAAARRCRFVHPFDDPLVIAGQGTMGLEILRQFPEVEVIVVPVGGGGLLAGVAVAVKALRPDVLIYAAEPSAACSFSAAMEKGRPGRVHVGRTFADGLAVGQVGAIGFAASAVRVDGFVSVSEPEIASAMLSLFEADGTVVEGAGAVALAALLSGKIPAIRGRRVAVPLCGANVDARAFSDALQLGLRRRTRSRGLSGAPASPPTGSRSQRSIPASRLTPACSDRAPVQRPE